MNGTLTKKSGIFRIRLSHRRDFGTIGGHSAPCYNDRMSPIVTEFYVVYPRNGIRYVAVVAARSVPAALQFDSYDDLYAAMDATGNAWTLVAEIEDPFAFENVSSNCMNR
jgi:hypothetical protein